MYLLGSTPPKVISPFGLLSIVVGSKETPRTFAGIRPREKALSVTVGIVAVGLSNNVPKTIIHLHTRYSGREPQNSYLP